MKSFNSKKISTVDNFIETFRTEKDTINDNIDVIYLNTMTMKVFNFFIDFGNIQEIYLYEFDNNNGIWTKKIIQVKVRGFLSFRNSDEQKIIKEYENKHM